MLNRLEEISELTMMNLSGVIVHRDHKPSNKKLIDTQGMVKGMYFLKARVPRGVRVVKVRIVEQLITVFQQIWPRVNILGFFLLWKRLLNNVGKTGAVDR